MSETKVSKGTRPITKLSTGRFAGAKAAKRFDRTYLRFGTNPVFAVTSTESGAVLRWIGPKAHEAATKFFCEGDAPVPAKRLPKTKPAA